MPSAASPGRDPGHPTDDRAQGCLQSTSVSRIVGRCRVVRCGAVVTDLGQGAYEPVQALSPSRLYAVDRGCDPDAGGGGMHL